MKRRRLLKKNKKQPKIRKMYLYVIIVNFGLADSIVNLLQEENSNVQIVSPGQGTASKEILRIIGVEDTRKDVILALADESNVQSIEKELNTLFLNSKRFMGMGFAIQMTSIVGEKIYHFLTNTI